MTSKILYEGQPTASLATVATGATDTVTKITFAEACNVSSDVITLDCYFGTLQTVKQLVLQPNETVTLFGVVGGTLEAADTLQMQASAATSVSVKVDGYEISTA